MERTLVVTGSASGIGAATTALARTGGDTVIGVDLHRAEVTADLSTPAGRLAATREVLERTDGRVDAVIACAGTAALRPQTLSINYFGTTEFLAHLRPALATSPAPRAAVVSSVAALQSCPATLVEAALSGDEPRTLAIAESFTSDDPMSGYVCYPASKRALSRWVRREAITADWAQAGIALNAVAPGTVRTPMTAELLASADGRALADAAVPMPLNYHQPPDSVAALLLWLCSAANTHTTGQVIFCDGGADASLRGDDIFSWND